MQIVSTSGGWCKLLKEFAQFSSTKQESGKVLEFNWNIFPLQGINCKSEVWGYRVDHVKVIKWYENDGSLKKIWAAKASYIFYNFFIATTWVCEYKT